MTPEGMGAVRVLDKIGKGLTLAAVVLAARAGWWMLFELTYSFATRSGKGIAGTMTAFEYGLLHQDPGYFFWPACVVAVSIWGAVAAWRNSGLWQVWAAGLVLTGVAVLGAWSIGAVVTPAAMFLLMAAAALETGKLARG